MATRFYRLKYPAVVASGVIVPPGFLWGWEEGTQPPGAVLDADATESDWAGPNSESLQAKTETAARYPLHGPLDREL